MIIFVVVKRGLSDREGSRHIYFCRVYSIRILGEIIDLSILCESEMLVVIILFTVLFLESGFFDSVKDAIGIRVGCVLDRDAVVRNAVESSVIRSHGRMSGTVDVIYILAGEYFSGVVGRTAEMNDDRIPLKSFVDKIGTDTAYVADPVKILPILHDTHLAAHVAFFHDLIEYIDSVETILGLRLFIDGEHESQRALFEKLLIHDLSGQRASGELGLGFGFGHRFRYRFGFRLRDRFGCCLDDCCVCCRSFLCLLFCFNCSFFLLSLSGG